MGGQGWFMKTELLQHFLYSELYRGESGEDLHFSYCLFKNDVPIYILHKGVDNKDEWQDLSLGKRGLDDKAQWRTKQHKNIRDQVLRHYTTKGWLSGRGNSTLI